MHNVGTDEPWVIERGDQLFGQRGVSAHYRRPLRIEEIAQMAPTAEVRARPGRP